MTHAQFKRIQLDHLIDMILEANGDVDQAYHQVTDEYPANNVQDYMNLTQTKLDMMTLTKSGSSTDPVDLLNAMKKCMLGLKSSWQHWGITPQKSGQILHQMIFKNSFPPTQDLGQSPQQHLPMHLLMSPPLPMLCQPLCW